MFKFIKKQNINKRGFSLVETLVALFVFSIAITATMAVMSQGITNINSAKKKVTASFLAQEGIEYVRNIMNTEMLFTENKIDAWNNILNKFAGDVDCMLPAGSTYGCYFIDDGIFSLSGNKPITQTPFYGCPSDNDCVHLKYDKDTGRYGYDLGTDSGFSRKIIFTSSLTNVFDYMKVDSIVYWRENGIIKSVTFTDYLTNWAE